MTDVPIFITEGGYVLADNNYDKYINLINFDFKKFDKEVDNLIKKSDKVAKTVGENFKSGMGLASSSLKSLSDAFPGFSGLLGDIVEKIAITKESINGMSSSFAKWSTGIGAGIEIAALLIQNVVGEIQKAEKEQQKIFEEGIQKSKEYTEQISILEPNIEILQNEQSTVEQVTAAKTELTNTFPDLIAGWTNEGEAILVTGDRLKKYLADAKELQELNYSKAAYSFNFEEKIAEYNKEADNLEILYKALAATGDERKEYMTKFLNTESQGSIGAAYVNGNSSDERINYWITETKLKINELENTTQSAIDARIKSLVKLKDANGIVIGTWKDLSNEQKYAVESYINDSIIQNKLLTGVLSPEIVANMSSEIVSDPDLLKPYLSQIEEATEASEQQSRIDRILTEQYGEQKASVEDLTEAYKKLIDNEILSDEQLHKLAITYPEINEYIKETGDFSLDSGLKIAEAMARLDVSPQIDSLNNLSSAYELLSSGQELSSEQLNTLIDQYPEIARFIIENGELTSQNCGILMEEYEIKKQNLIATLQNNQSEAQSQADKTRSIIKSIQSEIDARRALIESQGATYLASDVYQLNAEMGKQKKILEEQEKAAAKAAAALQRLENPPKVSGGNNRTSSAPKKTTPTRNEALQKELKQLEQKKKMDKLTSEEELKQLQRMQKKYKMNADEKADMEYRIYALKKKIREDEEKANSEKLKDEYKRIENKKSLDELSAKEELQWLKKIQKTFKMNKEEQMELTIKLYHLEQQIRDDSIESLNTIGDAVTEALKNKYEEQRKLEEKLIDDSIKSWEEWEEKTVAAIQGEIDALDELAESQEKEEQRAEYERKRQALTLQLSYERDDYNRKQLQKELNRLDEEERKRQEALAREERKKELEAEIEAAQKKAEEQRDALEKEKDKIGETYDELLKDANLRAEAERAIMEQSQKQIVEMIKSYAPDYDLAGQSIGEKLVDGFMKKVGDIEKYFDSIQDKITSYQQDMANVATKAADDFWKGRAEYEKKITAEAAKVQAESGGMTGVIADIRDYLSGEKKPQGFGQYSLEVNFNQPVESPVEMRRQLEKAMQELARKVGG